MNSCPILALSQNQGFILGKLGPQDTSIMIHLGYLGTVFDASQAGGIIPATGQNQTLIRGKS
uniref:Uncharacterized protein n=1 Tax=Candidatus Kentrum sp. FW TaxID=2126338 RepID=A0A450T220_9GAMM|nr:MAG: hypothetical protein BECKFW1821A_GA0114235_11042 [Candidatus Kentron sp. FW]